MMHLAFALLALSQANAQDSDEWIVDAPHGPETTFAQTFEEGTWISVDVSPDGEHIAFDHLGHIWEMPIAGGEATALTSGRSWNMFPRYSPDGTRIAFTSDRGGSNDLWVLDRISGELDNASDMKLPVFQGTWSLDGRALYGTALNMKVRFPAYRFNFHGEKQEIVPADARAPVNDFREHPTQDAIYYVHQDGSLPTSGPRIKRLDTRTGETETYIDRPGGAAAIALSPNGEQLAYVHRNDQATELVLHDFETESERVLLRGLDRGRFDSRSFYGTYSNIAWHPSGDEVVLSTGGGIVAVDVSDGSTRAIPFRVAQSRPITTTARFPVRVPRNTAQTLSARWSQPIADGVLYEALGDLFWLRADGERVNLTNSADHETSPLYDAAGRRVFFATWNDVDKGAVAVLDLDSGERRTLTDVASQYGALALAPDGETLAYLRGNSDIRKGTRLESQTGFELVVLAADGTEEVVTDVEWLGNRYAHRPPTVRFGPDGDELFFSEYVGDELTLKRIDRDGDNEHTLIVLPNATRAVLSPDFEWIAYREYHRTFVTPFEFVGKTLTVSAADGNGFAQRVDAELDGDFTEWNAAGDGLYWTRGAKHYAKSLADILAGTEGAASTELAFEYEIDRPEGIVALTNARVLTMDDERRVLENATVLVDGSRIAAVGVDIDIPASARVIDLSGRTIMPGMFDAHGHYGSPISALNVIEQRLYGLHANLAYGVTTMFDVYGTTQKDFWVSDMLRAGRIDGPRIYSVGDPVFVTKYRLKMHRPIESLDDALEIANFNRDHGATALKDYSNHRREARQQLASASRELGLNLVTESFANAQMNLTQVVDGFTGIEHTMGLTPLYDDVLSLFAASKIGMTPTLIVVYDGPAGETWFHQRERLWEDPKLLRFFRTDELLRHRRPTHYFEDDFRHPSMAAEVKKLHDRGVLLQMGAHGQMMGLGAHWEVEMFVHGGFTPLEALAIATINGFTHHGLDGDLGSIEAGKLADLVVLHANPLDDIRNTRHIDVVMKNGRMYSGEDASRIAPDRGEYQPMYFHDR